MEIESDMKEIQSAGLSGQEEDHCPVDFGMIKVEPAETFSISEGNSLQMMDENALVFIKIEPSEVPDLEASAGQNRAPKFLESTLNEWYARMSSLGPVEDSEILEAANQLAQNFKLECSVDLKWVEGFKLRLSDCSNNAVDSPDYGNSNQVDPSNHNVDFEVDPPLKIRRCAEATCNFSSDTIETVDNSEAMKAILDELIQQFVVHNGTNQLAEQSARQFLDELLIWLMEMSSSQKLCLYQVRLHVAEWANNAGVVFNLSDDWFINAKKLRPALFVNTNSNYFKGSLEVTDEQLFEWYSEQSANRLVSASELEREAIRNSKCPGSKNYFRRFIEGCGLHCNINGQRTWLWKPAVGLLKCKFDAAFEVWYYDWPVPIDGVQVDECNLDEKNWSRLTSYLATLSEWYVEMCRTGWVTESDIEQKQWEFAKMICQPGLSTEDIQSWSNKWSCSTYRTMHDIVKFNDRLKGYLFKVANKNKGTSTSENAMLQVFEKIFSLQRSEVQRKAEALAESMVLRGFCCSKKWLRRFVLLYGQYSEGNDLKLAAEYFAGRSDEFNNIFEEWYERPSVSQLHLQTHIKKRFGLKVNKKRIIADEFAGLDILMDKFHEQMERWYDWECQNDFVQCTELKQNAYRIALEVGLHFRATKSWIIKFLKSQGVTFSNNDTLMTKPAVLSASLAGDVVSFDAWYNGTDHPKESKVPQQNKPALFTPHRITLNKFRAEVHQWYVRESSAHLVTPCEVEKKTHEVAGQLQIKGFILTKEWIANLFGERGLYCNINGNNVLLPKAKNGPLKQRFDIELDAWYLQYPIDIDSLMPDDNNDRVNLACKLYQEALALWFARDSITRRISSSADIKEAEPQIAEFGQRYAFTPKVISKCIGKWLKMYSDVTNKMHQFQDEMSSLYKANKLYQIVAQELMKVANQKAHSMGLKDFQASENWLKRFAKVNGIYFISAKDKLKLFINAADLRATAGVDSILNKWCTQNPLSELLSAHLLTGPTSPLCVSDPDSVCFHVTENPLPLVRFRHTIWSSKYLAFKSEIYDWYHEESLKRMVPVYEFEFKVFKVSESKGVPDVYPGKKCWLKKFVGVEGIYWYVDGVPQFISKADHGILMWQFDAAFEAWYYGWPTMMAEVEDESAYDKCRAESLKMFLKTLNDWHQNTLRSKNVTVKAIKLKEALLVASQPEILPWYTELNEKFSSWINAIQTLNANMGLWYGRNAGQLKCGDLKNEARTSAYSLGATVFSASKTWLKRFLQLHGFCVIKQGKTEIFGGLAQNPGLVAWFDIFNAVSEKGLSGERASAVHENATSFPVGCLKVEGGDSLNPISTYSEAPKSEEESVYDRVLNEMELLQVTDGETYALRTTHGLMCLPLENPEVSSAHEGVLL